MNAAPVLLALFALSGCAIATQIGPAGADPTPTVIGEGIEPANEILITRPTAVGLVTNVFTKPAILLNGEEVGRCQTGAPLLLRVPDGPHTITARTANGEVSQVVSVMGGDVVKLTCGTSAIPSLGPKPVLTLDEASL